MKILTIIGARPQFIKASIVSKRIRESFSNIEEILVHTGQHYDDNMSRIFFEQMDILTPRYNLKIGNLSHGAMTGRMLESIESIIKEVNPNYLLVYGDTNSTLAGALAAAKIHVPVIHVEAGLRSFNIEMPEEINRILTDQISSILFCPTDKAVSNLKNEGFGQKSQVTIIKNGDVMYDAMLWFEQFAEKPPFNIPTKFILATFHRAENTDNTSRLKEIIFSLNKINKEIPVICPLHPRTKKIIKETGFPINFFISEPVGYLEMLYLLKHTTLVMTDSGGLQKEAFFFKHPCITVRDQTEWMELVEMGVNTLTKADEFSILNTYHAVINKTSDFPINSYYGEGNASNIIIDYLKTRN